MIMAVDLARQSKDEPGRSTPAPRVGAVAVRDGTLIATGFRGEAAAPDHAEYELIKKLGVGSGRLCGATVYTTLEPCTTRGEDKRPCANRLIDEGVAVVVIGMYDPDPRVYRAGWRMLKEAGIVRFDFSEEHRNAIRELNRPFIETYQRGSGDSGVATLDPTQNDGEFYIDTDTAGPFITAWGQAGPATVYARDDEHMVGDARYVTELDEIDDPAAYAFDSHSRPVSVGDIALFTNGDDFLLVKVIEVHDTSRGAGKNAVKIEWRARSGKR